MEEPIHYDLIIVQEKGREFYEYLSLAEAEQKSGIKRHYIAKAVKENKPHKEWKFYKRSGHLRPPYVKGSEEKPKQEIKVTPAPDGLPADFNKSNFQRLLERAKEENPPKTYKWLTRSKKT